jgi:hypothetical protein
LSLDNWEPHKCSAQPRALLQLGTPWHWSTQSNPLEPQDGTECPCHLFHIGVIDMAQDADDPAFIDDPNLLAEDHGIVG